MCDRSFLIVYNSEIATTGTHHNKIRLLPRYFTTFICSKTAKQNIRGLIFLWKYVTSIIKTYLQKILQLSQHLKLEMRQA